MDTGREYIEMCRKAVEVQGLLKEGRNQYFVSLFESTKDELVFGVLERDLIHGYYVDDCEFMFHVYEKMHIWLPRQDQLQEMVQYNNDKILDIMEKHYRYYDFLLKQNSESLETMWQKHPSYEQLWLAFAMKEKFNKVWNGSDWKESQ